MLGSLVSVASCFNARNLPFSAARVFYHWDDETVEFECL